MAPAWTPRAGRLLAVGCLALAAISLLAARAPTYDPWAWLIWGRQIASGELDTVGGPSWKPFPVLFTSLFSLVHSPAAPALWLVVARTAGLVAIAVAFRLGQRLAGTAAGVVAALALTIQTGFVPGFVRGNSEAILVALSLWAIDRHLDARHRQAFVLAALAALLRPEVWPFVGAYALWLVREAWGEHPPWGLLLVIAGAGVATALLWFVPEYLGSGSLLRGASRARETVEGSPATASFPFAAVFSNSASALPVPVYAGAVAAVLLAARDRPRRWRSRVVLGIAAVATAYMVVIAALAQAGFTGNLRYATLPAALVCVLAGAGFVAVAEAVRARTGRRATAAVLLLVAAASAPFVVDAVSGRLRQMDRVAVEDAEAEALPRAVDRAGGTAALLRCGRIFTGPFETQLVAWTFRLRQSEVGIEPEPPGTTLLAVSRELPADPRFTPVVTGRRWTIASTCRRAR